jgi:O-antigen/teichoic acid export membrane protein
LRDNRQALVAQFLQFTRLNLLAVLPFVVLILLVIPEFLRIFYGHGKWTASDLAACGEAARLLCLVGTLRALGFVGPPLLDGIGRPELTLRYMMVAAIAVPGSFVLSAELLGARLGLLSVAVAWAVGYPIAFVALSYLVTRSLKLPLWAYARASWGIVGCCLAGLAAGFGVSLALASASDPARMVWVGATALAVTFALVATWQKITPRSITRSIKG